MSRYTITLNYSDNTCIALPATEIDGDAVDLHFVVQDVRDAAGARCAHVKDDSGQAWGQGCTRVPDGCAGYWHGLAWMDGGD